MYQTEYSTPVVFDFPELTKTNIDPIINGLGTVLMVNAKGKILRIRGRNRNYRVLNQYRDLPLLEAGDPVHFVGNQSGVYIIGAFATNHSFACIGFQPTDIDTLELNFGNLKLTLSAFGDIIISNKKASIEINNQGTIKLDTLKNVKIAASERIDLN